MINWLDNQIAAKEHVKVLRALHRAKKQVTMLALVESLRLL